MYSYAEKHNLNLRELREKPTGQLAAKPSNRKVQRLLCRLK